jgi:hypothetical protein
MSSAFLVARTSPDGGPSRYTSAAAEGTAGKLVKGPTSPAIAVNGRVYKVHAINNASTAYTVMVFDKATAPVNADVPIWRGNLATGAGSECVLDLMGISCINGIGVAISSTRNTLTLAVGNDVFWHILYQ